MFLDFNMPMQIVTKKESPVMVKNIVQAQVQNNSNSNNSNNSNKNVTKDVSPDKPVIVRTNKKTPSIDDKTYEDRILPIEIARSKSSRKSISNMVNSVAPSNKTSGNTNTNNIATPDLWICDVCTTVNKPYEYKCQGDNI